MWRNRVLAGLYRKALRARHRCRAAVEHEVDQPDQVGYIWITPLALLALQVRATVEHIVDKVNQVGDVGTGAIMVDVATLHTT